ncbi:structural maintenance of chromosomes protein [Anaeramoeba ignava]|uniref:Structural maintenance of chromosomes protein n=1 Tax=Anaeramoeba ignava TaxID=1746090 RepID=A0A9Q0RD49_ANAIG|nr:structural maintenance of chromosomes protein [Anaeramoeba ignava]|eukprot:Anaeramoba_ignava/a610249_86.p1 GENE.a610249_86~~a610249_86.p1  ORF type:complete len:443 (+),score=161.22 a610249_86:10-1338(+)
MTDLDQFEENLSQEKVQVVEQFVEIIKQKDVVIGELVSELQRLTPFLSTISEEKSKLLFHINENYSELDVAPDLEKEQILEKEDDDSAEIYQKLKQERDDLAELIQKTEEPLNKMQTEMHQLQSQSTIFKQKYDAQKENHQDLHVQNEQLKETLANLQKKLEMSRNDATISQILEMQKLVRELNQESQQEQKDHEKQMSQLVSEIQKIESEIELLKKDKLDIENGTFDMNSYDQQQQEQELKQQQQKEQELKQQQMQGSPLLKRGAQSNVFSRIKEVPEFSTQNTKEVRSHSFTNRSQLPHLSPSPIEQANDQPLEDETQIIDPEEELAAIRATPVILRTNVKVKENPAKGLQLVLLKKNKWTSYDIGLWNGLLVFFNQKTEEPAYQMRLNKTLKITRVDKSVTKKPNCLELRTTKEVFYLWFDLLGEEESWFRAIRKSRIL